MLLDVNDMLCLFKVWFVTRGNQEQMITTRLLRSYKPNQHNFLQSQELAYLYKSCKKGYSQKFTVLEQNSSEERSIVIPVPDFAKIGEFFLLSSTLSVDYKRTEKGTEKILTILETLDI